MGTSIYLKHSRCGFCIALTFLVSGTLGVSKCHRHPCSISFLLVLEKKACFHKTLGLISSGKSAKKFGFISKYLCTFPNCTGPPSFPRLPRFNDIESFKENVIIPQRT